MWTKPGVSHCSVVTLWVAKILRDVMHFLSGEKWAIAVPLLAVFRGERKRTFASADPDS
jgi:hypothetical protein